MSNDYRAYVENDYLSIYHHGIKGMKWGVRRFQNKDGSLTPEGQERYNKYRKHYEDQGYTKSEAKKRALQDLKYVPKGFKISQKERRGTKALDSYESKLKSRYDKVKKENPKWIIDNFGYDSFEGIINNDPDLLDMALDEYDLEKKSKRRSR